MARRRQGSSSAGAIVLVLLVTAFLWWNQAGGPADPSSDRARDPGSSGQSQSQPRTQRPRQPATDPVSGLRWVAARDLPGEARQTLARIDAGGPFPEDEDDETFGNYEGILPDEPRGYYREYTVHTPGYSGRGARRIVAGQGGQYYWTADHYASFARIRR